MPAEIAVPQPGLLNNVFKINPDTMTLRDWQVVCDYLAMSDIVPESLVGKPANIFLVIHMGIEMGVSWVRALQTIYSPGAGQTGVMGTLLIRNIRLAGHKIRWEQFDGGCTCKIWRKDEPDDPYEATYTMKDAERAGLTGKRNWRSNPREMCLWRSTSHCANFACPEVTLGFYMIEAMDGPEPVQLAPQTPAPGTGQAAPGGNGPAQELAGIEREFTPGTREAVDAYQEASSEIYYAEPGTGGEAGEPETGGVPEGGGDAEDLPATTGERQALSDEFSRLGYRPVKHLVDVRRVMSAWARRKILSSRDMSGGEVTALTAELQEIPAEPQGMVVLADRAAAWLNEWEAEDPDSYAEVAHDPAVVLDVP